MRIVVKRPMEGGAGHRRTAAPDLVVTDLTMPRLNGIELTRHIRQELPRTMVILMIPTRGLPTVSWPLTAAPMCS